jgi:hypothetical protein
VNQSDGCSEAVLIISSYSLPETSYLGSRWFLWGYHLYIIFLKTNWWTSRMFVLKLFWLWLHILFLKPAIYVAGWFLRGYLYIRFLKTIGEPVGWLFWSCSDYFFIFSPWSQLFRKPDGLYGDIIFTSDPEDHLWNSRMVVRKLFWLILKILFLKPVM